MWNLKNCLSEERSLEDLNTAGKEVDFCDIYGLKGKCRFVISEYLAPTVCEVLGACLQVLLGLVGWRRMPSLAEVA